MFPGGSASIGSWDPDHTNPLMLVILPEIKDQPAALAHMTKWNHAPLILASEIQFSQILKGLSV